MRTEKDGIVSETSKGASGAEACTEAGAGTDGGAGKGTDAGAVAETDDGAGAGTGAESGSLTLEGVKGPVREQET